MAKTLAEIEVAPRLTPVPPPARVEHQWFGHPRGLSTLFFTELWERFSYYGMRAILVLFMTNAIATGGLGMTDGIATAIYGLYTAIVMTAAGALLDPTGKLINGPTNAISIALFSALAIVEGTVEQRIQYAVLLALLMGLIQVGITLLRLGDLTRYISHAVIVGFGARRKM